MSRSILHNCYFREAVAGKIVSESVVNMVVMILIINRTKFMLVIRLGAGACSDWQIIKVVVIAVTEEFMFRIGGCWGCVCRCIILVLYNIRLFGLNIVWIRYLRNVEWDDTNQNMDLFNSFLYSKKLVFMSKQYWMVYTFVDYTFPYSKCANICQCFLFEYPYHTLR